MIKEKVHKKLEERRQRYPNFSMTTIEIELEELEGIEDEEELKWLLQNSNKALNVDSTKIHKRCIMWKIGDRVTVYRFNKTTSEEGEIVYILRNPKVFYIKFADGKEESFTEDELRA